MQQPAIHAQRQAALRIFVRKTFGPRGTWHLHWAGVGLDVLRAPVNVLLSPVLLLVRLLALMARLVRLRQTSLWLMRRKVLLQTNVSQKVGVKVKAFLKDLDARGIGVDVPTDVLDHEIAEYTGVRSAVGEITTTALVLLAGYFMFQTVTPGLISLTGPVAEMRAQTTAVEGFPLGQRLGRMYYGVFDTQLTTWQVVVTGIVLAMAASVFATFAGLIVDPLQVLTGTHRRRLARLIRRLDADTGGGGLAREHITARLADLSDMVLNLWRILRG